MPDNADILFDIGSDWVLKLARVVPECILYGIYLFLVTILFGILYRKGLRGQGSNIFLMVVTVLMFLGATLFLCLDVADLVMRIQLILLHDPHQTDFSAKLNQANHDLKKFIWTGEMLFIFMLVLGDSIVVWRTWAICFGKRRWLLAPIGTWTGSLIAAFFELGCELRTHWAASDLNYSASSVGAETCSHADLSSFTLSYVTNILCTLLIAYRVWEYRNTMVHYLGRSRTKTQVEKVLIMVLESGFVYIILYTLQAVPIYGAKLTHAGLTTFNVVNAIIQQAIGIYPTLIIVFVKLNRSVWDAAEITGAEVHPPMRFAPGTSRESPVRGIDGTHTAIIKMTENERDEDIEKGRRTSIRMH